MFQSTSHNKPQSQIVFTILMPRVFFLLFVVVATLSLPSWGYGDDTLVVYSGRAERLIQPALDAFQAETGINVQMLTADSTALITGFGWKESELRPTYSSPMMRAPWNARGNCSYSNPLPFLTWRKLFPAGSEPRTTVGSACRVGFG